MAIETLSDQDQVDAYLQSGEPRWVFKHSNACGISFAAHEQVERYAAEHPDEAIGMVVIQEHRPLSNHIAERLERVHQSPQLFLVRAGEVLWTATHYSITAEAMASARAEAQRA